MPARLLWKTGVFVLGDLQFKPGMIPENLSKSEFFTGSVNAKTECGHFSAKKKPIDIDGNLFTADVYTKRGKVTEIALSPIGIREKIPEDPDLKYQAEKRKFCDAFLKKKAGTPSEKTNIVTRYCFKWGTISCYSFLYSEKLIGSGGDIYIKYTEEN